MGRIVSIVDSKSGHKMINNNQPFILVLKKDENIFEAILRFANDAQLKSASLSGLGALDDVTVAYYHLDKKEYTTKLFEGGFELVSLNGNISFVDGKLSIHIHAALGLPDFTVFGGHIMDATVGPTAEITIIPLQEEIHRKASSAIGLNLMCPMAD